MIDVVSNNMKRTEPVCFGGDMCQKAMMEGIDLGDVENRNGAVSALHKERKRYGMNGAQFIKHDGIEILWIDFSHVTSLDEIVRIMEEAKSLLVTRAPGSVLTLTDTTGTHFDAAINQAFKEYAAHNKSYVKAAALVGITPIRKIIYNAVAFFSGRHLELFDDIESAKGWLAGQG